MRSIVEHGSGEPSQSEDFAHPALFLFRFLLAELLRFYAEAMK